MIVGPRHFLACDKIKISECNWIIKKPSEPQLKVLVKLRNSSKPVSGIISIDSNNGLSELYFDQPQYGVSTGQAAVFYNTEEYEHVLGGGWIAHAPNMYI